MPTCPLSDIFAQIPDPRRGQGKRYSLESVMLLACAAILCGYRSYSAMAEWGVYYGTTLLQALGFTHDRAPCAATFCNIFRHLNVTLVEQQLQQWAESVHLAIPPAEGVHEGIALDGKTLRGSRKQGAPSAHLLSALGHRLGLTLSQQAVADKTNEIGAIQEVLHGLLLQGRVVTVDALLTQRHVAQTVVEKGGDYVMVVKDNHRQLHQDLAYLFRMPWKPNQFTAQTRDEAHGRVEVRQITTMALSGDFVRWPGAQQVFQLERTVVLKKSNKVRHEVVHGLSSLSVERATPADLLHLVRQHWHIENRSHWVRDVTFGEDLSQVRVGSTPQVMAALRNLAIGLMRAAGITSIAAACRRFAAQPTAALALLGI